MSTGGVQPTPDPMPAPVKTLKDKIMLSERVLTKEGCEELKKRLGRNKKVVLVGGSHSAFSVAWVLLNCLNDANAICQGNAKNGAKEKEGEKGGEHPKNNNIYFQHQEVTILHRSAIRVFYNTKREAERDSYPIGERFFVKPSFRFCACRKLIIAIFYFF